MSNTPAKPPNSFRVTLTLSSGSPRLDQPLLEALRAQNDNPTLKALTRSGFKALFKERRILIKGQSANPSSGLAQGTTVVDILGFEEKA